MKKIIYYIMLPIITLSFFGCSEDDDIYNSSEKSGSSDIIVDGKYYIVNGIKREIPQPTARDASEWSFDAVENAMQKVKNSGDYLELYINEYGKIVCEKSNFSNTKDKSESQPDFISTDEKEFYRWVDARLEEGYTVTIAYDKEKKCFYAWLWVI